MTMKKELFFTKPPITVFTYHAYPLAIAQMNRNFTPWFHSHFIQLLTKITKPGDFFTDFYFPYGHELRNYKCLEVNRINSSIVPRSSLLSLIKRLIDNDEYIYMYVNDFYIKDRPFYRRHHLIHDILIYGYDDDRERFNISGFNRDKIFGKYELPYSEFIMAYEGVISEAASHKVICSIRNNDDFSFTFDIDAVLEGISDYVKGINSSVRYRQYFEIKPDESYVFGTLVYPQLAEYLIRHEKCGYDMDIASFHLLWEHKCCMYQRLCYMSEHGYVKSVSLSAYKIVEEQALLLRNIMVKYLVSRNKTLIEKALGILACVHENELRVLESIL